jgi:hypothetical protein
VKLREVGCAAVGQHHAAIAAIVGLAHRGVDADLGSDAAHQQIFDAVLLQHVAEFGGVERALARFVDHHLIVERVEFGNDVVAGLAANENAPHRAGIADPQGRRAALDLGRRRIRQIGQMTLAGVHDQHADVAGRFQHRCDRLHRARELGDVVAERFTEAAGLHEIALHVDDEKRGRGEVEHDRLRLRGDRA